MSDRHTSTTLEAVLKRDYEAFLARSSSTTVEPYTPGPESLPQDGVPCGTVTQYQWASERTYPGTERAYWIYVPAQYDASQAACLMVFQDGEMYLGADANVATVFDNLIHKGVMPITIGLFINAGDKGPGNPLYGGTGNRSVEYDSLGDQYARFLIEEILPEIEARYTLVKHLRAAPSVASAQAASARLRWRGSGLTCSARS
jgi:enterochelin esterase-like enzyme